MTFKPVPRLRATTPAPRALLPSPILVEVVSGGGGDALAAPLTETTPVVQWLSEAVQQQLHSSFELLRARLRVARARLREGLHSPAASGRDEFMSLTTLLATDLEAFTPMLERLGDMRAQELMHLHNEILRSCLRRHHGREVVHTGDGVLAAFRSPLDALQCAMAMQRKLAVHNQRHPNTPLRVRIGLHAGLPLPEENRLFGACVNTTVRVCSVATPGSIFATDLVLKLLGTSRFSCVDRGDVRLKGISVPQHLHEVQWQPELQPSATLN